MSTNDFGRKFVVEECQKVELPDFLKRYRRALKELTITSEMEAMDIKIEMTTSKTGYGGTRYWENAPSVALGLAYYSNIPLPTP
jgi:hypothetical protein